MAQETITLRAPTPGDRATWGALWTAYLAFYETTLPDSIHDAAFAALLSDDPASFRGLMAWDGDRALGLVHWVHHPHLWRPEGVHYLQDLFTVPEARGRGVARRLIEAVYAQADAAGARHVYWTTQATNTTARKLYDRIGVDSGFVRYERPRAAA